MADDQNPQIPFLVPPLPELETHATTTSSSTTGGSADHAQEAPERAAVRSDIDQLTGEHTDAMNAKLAHDQAAAGIDADYKKAQLEQFDANQAAHDKAVAATQPGIDEWKTRLRDSMEKYDRAPAPALFADKTTPEKLKDGLALLLAGIGDAMGTAAMVRTHQGQGNFNAVSQIIEADLTRQRESIQKLSDRIVQAKTGLADAQAARQQLLAEVDQRGATAFKRVDLMAASRLAAAGKDAPLIQATLDNLGWKQKAIELKEQSVAPLVDHVTTKYDQTRGKNDETINRSPPAAKPGATPTHINDQLTGKEIPVDPTATDQRQHNAATAKLAPVNTFIDTANKLLKDAEANGPAQSEMVAKAFNNEPAQAGRSAAITRLRSAYISAKSESLGKDNAEHLAETAIPDPPSSTFSTKGAWNAWLTKIKAVNDEMHQLRGEHLANAGVRLPDVAAARSTSGSAAPAPAAAPARAPATPAAQPSKRDRAIQLLREYPQYGNASLLRKVYGITDQELRP